MHTLFVLAAMMLALLVGGAGILLLRLAPPEGRRSLAMVVLGAPPFVLLLATLHLLGWFGVVCAPPSGWDRVTSLGLLLALGGVAASALGLNLVRLVLVERLLASRLLVPNELLSARAARLAGRLCVAPPAVSTLGVDAPLAVGGGLRRPSIVLSRWLVERLDARELEAVLAHELAHLARRDHLTFWLGHLLRDATIYLPSSWYALRVLEADAELAADALAVGVTRRPLAMASALGKVWQGAAGGPLRLAGLPGYAGASADVLEERLRRLLDGRPRRSGRWGQVLAGANVLSVGYLAPRLLAASASALPLVCTLRPF